MLSLAHALMKQIKKLLLPVQLLFRPEILQQLLIALLFSSQWAFAQSVLPGLQADFPLPQKDFGLYIEDARDHISRYRMSAREDRDTEINLPFELNASPGVAYRGRFLLFHGLNDSPYVWRDMAESLAGLGFDVRAILLPGSGTTPVAMLDVSYRDWLLAARKHFANWYQPDVPIFLGGFSLGGVIATILALENPEVAGLLLVSPAYHSKLNHLLRWSWIYQRYRPWLFGGMIIEDNPAKYNSITINSGTQYYNTTRYLKKRWGRKKLSMPVVMVATADDSVVDVDYMRSIYRKRFVSDQRRFVLYTNDTSIMMAGTEVHRRSVNLDLRILNQSHLSLINNLDNPLFGQSREILVCNGNEPEIFFSCLRAQEHWFGAQHTPSPDGIDVARTTYNPDYDFIIEQIDEVLRTK